MKPSVFKEFTKIAIAHKHSFLVKSAPGVGKTEIISQACEETQTHVIVTHPVVSDPTDYKGLPFMVEEQGRKKARFLPFGDLEDLIMATENTAFFMDDLGQAPPSVQAAVMQLILGRKINGHEVSDTVSFIGATNRKSDKAAVTGILEPVKSRFRTIIELQADVDDWVAWAARNDIPPEMIGFIRWRPELLHNFTPTQDMTNSPCPRTIENVAHWVKVGLPKEMELEVYSGAAGEGLAGELVGYLRMYRDLPDLDNIIKYPNKAKIDGEPNIMYAICAGVARKATIKNMENIVKYAGRISAEFSVLLIRDAVNFNEEVVETDAFIKWASDHEDVLVG